MLQLFKAEICVVGWYIFLLSFEKWWVWNWCGTTNMHNKKNKKSFFKTRKHAEHTNKNHFPKHAKQVEQKNKNHFQKHAKQVQHKNKNNFQNMQSKYNKKIKIISKTCKKKIEQKN